MNDTLTDTDISAAEDELLRDVDTLQDWIGGECSHFPVQPWLPQLKDFDATVHTVPALLAFAFDRGQFPTARFQALNELADRFLQDNSVHVLARASEIADERIADQAESLRDERREAA